MKKIILLIAVAFSFTYINAQTDSTKNKDIFDMSLEELMNIEVEVSTKIKSTIDESPGIVTVINRKMIERTCAQTLADIIRMVPGLDFSKSSLGWGEPIDEFYGRGVLNSFSQTILLLFNGQNRFNDFTYASPFMSSRINVDMIERIEIIRGPGSALYGGNAFAAVINIITRDKSDRSETIFETSGGENPHGSIYLLTKHKLFKTNWKIGLQGKYFFDKGRTYANVQEDKKYTKTKLPQADKITDGIDPSYDLSLNISAPKNKFNAQIWHTEHNPHPFLTGFFPQPNTYKYQTKQTFLNIDFQPIKNLTISGYHSFMSWDSRLSLYSEPETTVGTRYSDVDLYGTSQKNSNSAANIAYIVNIKKHNIYIGANYSIDNQSSPRTTYHSTIAKAYGYDISNNSNKEIVLTEKDIGWVSYLPQERNKTSVLVQDNWQISKKLAATIGIRYDYYDDLKENDIINPRLALVWHALKNSKIKFLFGQAFRPPSPSETSIILSPLKGNPDLLPEKIKTGEIAFIHYLPFARFQINGFYSIVQNPINYVSKGVLVNGDLWDTYENLGGAEMYGGELEIQAKFWWLNYSFVDSKINNGDGEYSKTPFIASHHINAGVYYTFFNKLTISNQIFYKSARNEINENQGDTKSYIVNDILVGYVYKFFKLSVGCRNIFDNVWEMPLIDGGNYSYPYRGRELFAKLTFKFKY